MLSLAVLTGHLAESVDAEPISWHGVGPDEATFGESGLFSASLLTVARIEVAEKSLLELLMVW